MDAIRKERFILRTKAREKAYNRIMTIYEGLKPYILSFDNKLPNVKLINAWKENEGKKHPYIIFCLDEGKLSVFNNADRCYPIGVNMVDYLRSDDVTIKVQIALKPKNNGIGEAKFIDATQTIKNIDSVLNDLKTCILKDRDATTKIDEAENKVQQIRNIYEDLYNNYDYRIIPTVLISEKDESLY